MTQFLRGQPAYPATTSLITQPASSELQNLSYMNNRIQKALLANGTPPSPGTAMYGQSFTQSTTIRWMELTDPVFAAITAAGYVPAAGDTSQNTTPSPTPNLNSNLVNMYNPGVHAQVVDFWGDSITASDIGGGTFPEMATEDVFFFMQPIVQMGVPFNFILAPDGEGPNICYTCASLTNPRSRLTRNFGQDSNRASNVPAGPWGAAYTYVLGSPWLDNAQNFAGSSFIFPHQQHVNVIWLGTNDINFADSNGNGGLGSVPVGTPGFNFAQAPNYIEQSLMPLLAVLKNMDPNAKTVWIGSNERGSSVSENGKFVEIDRYLIANMVALGIDVVIDSRTFVHFDPDNLALSNDPNWYQADNTHMTPIGYTDRVDGIPARVLRVLDNLLGF